MCAEAAVLRDPRRGYVKLQLIHFRSHSLNSLPNDLRWNTSRYHCLLQISRDYRSRTDYAVISNFNTA
jgi:hypothetical protein